LSLIRIPFNERILALEDASSDVFAIHDVATRSGDRVVVFRGQFLRSPDLVFETVSPAFRRLGFVPILRQEDGGDVLMAYPAPAAAGQSSTAVHLSLFLITVVTTLWAGFVQATGQTSLSAFADGWTAGVPFAVALLGILGVHEFGHYVVARRYGLDVTLPYFIPFPLNPFTGTLGAVIRIKSPFESKKALFDVGIAGPLAGLAVAIPVVAIGLAMAEIATFNPGDSLMTFSEPLLFQWMARLIVGERPPGTDILMNPLLMAGWLGFLITAINLVPISQLDGGHIAYSILGPRYRLFAWAMYGFILLLIVTRARGFLLMAILIMLMGIDHPPALNDLTKVGKPRVVLGLATFALALTLVTLTPFSETQVPPASDATTALGSAAAIPRGANATDSRATGPRVIPCGTGARIVHEPPRSATESRLAW
jgi:membrane-associated protease RseP (regulator of RpoE activity)